MTNAAIADTNTSEGQARAQLESIKAMVERLEHCQECEWLPGDDHDMCKLDPIEAGSLSDEAFETYHDEDDARQAIAEDPLSVEVRTDWYTLDSDSDRKPSEFRILLCTGGPTVQIRGELNEHGEPKRAWLEHQDWGTPWTQLVEPGSQDALLRYAREFYFGE